MQQQIVFPLLRHTKASSFMEVAYLILCCSCSNAIVTLPKVILSCGYHSNHYPVILAKFET